LGPKIPNFGHVILGVPTLGTVLLIRMKDCDATFSAKFGNPSFIPLENIETPFFTRILG